MPFPIKLPPLISESQFWKSIKSYGGTPLIEDIPGDQQNKKVTFFWQGSIESQIEQQVYVLFDSKRGEDFPVKEEDRLKKIPGTHIYSLSINLPVRLLTTYTFYIPPKIININDSKSLKDDISKNGNHTDPNNPNVFDHPANNPNRLFPPDKNECHSILSMPLAPKNQFLPADAYKKLLELKEEKRFLECEMDFSKTKALDRLDHRNYKFFIDSEPNDTFFKKALPWRDANANEKSVLLLKNKNTQEWGLFCGGLGVPVEGELFKKLSEIDPSKDSLTVEIQRSVISLYLNSLESGKRKYWVYLPRNYEKMTEPCKLLLQLDGDAYVHLGVPSVVDKMIEKKIIPPTLVVFLNAPFFLEERMKEYGCNDAFTNFLAKMFVPMIRKQYQCSTMANDTMISGSSMGGLAALYAGLTHGEVFGHVISQSGALWSNRDKIIQALHEFVKINGKTNFIMDAGTLETGLFGNPVSLLQANREMAARMKEKYPKCNYIYSEFLGDHNFLCWQASWSQMLKLTCNHLLKANKEMKCNISTRKKTTSLFDTPKESINPLKSTITHDSNKDIDISDDDMAKSSFGQGSNVAQRLRRR